MEIKINFAMRTNVTLLILLLVTLVDCSRSALHSDLTVQPGKQFVLGGNQKGAFNVQASNKGQVSVTLSERRADGKIISLGEFVPGNKQTIRFGAGSAVLVDNRSDKSARLDLTVTGDKENLTMQERNPENQ